ncbi:MAG: glycosyltransferase family 2 protein [Candidatus Omnitrophota bacterium]
MTAEIVKSGRKRSFQDKLISGYNSLRYMVTEPIKLRLVRAKQDRFYSDKTENPLVSVYIPTYNRGDILIKRAVPSVLAQTYKNFELIIVGDHCTDNTEELVLKIDDPRVRFYNLTERKYRYPETAENHWFAGPVVAANKALELVRGKWIARIDDDDTWTEDHIEVLLSHAQENAFEFVSASYLEERHGKKTVIDVKNKTPRIGGSLTWFYRSYLKFFKYNIDCWRKSWNRVNDTDLRNRFFLAGVRIGFLDRVVGYVLPRPGENTIGLDAYQAKEKEKKEHFKFTG